MKRLPHPLILFLLLVTATLGTGCSTVHVVHRDPGFTYAALQSGGLAIAPVTRRDTADYYAAEPIAAAIHEQLTEDLPGLPILPAAKLQNILGRTNTAALREAFHELVELPPSAFPLLDPLAPHARYILFVSITRDEILDNSGIYEVTTYESYYDPVTGDHYAIPITTPAAQKGTIRSLYATFVIYDLALARETWRARSAADGHITRPVSPYRYTPGTGIPGGPTPSDLIRTITTKMATQLSRE